MRSPSGRIGVRDDASSSLSMLRRERLSTIVISWSRADRCNAVGHPQKPSPPRTRIFTCLTFSLNYNRPWAGVPWEFAGRERPTKLLNYRVIIPCNWYLSCAPAAGQYAGSETALFRATQGGRWAIPRCGRTTGSNELAAPYRAAPLPRTYCTRIELVSGDRKEVMWRTLIKFVVSALLIFVLVRTRD